jgi:hypothetical protein
MASVTCSSCSKTEKSGKIFYQCEACNRWWCSDHGSTGKKCVCGRGFMKR